MFIYQNVLEIHIGKLFLSQDTVLNPDEKIFVVLNFYHFETVITKGMSLWNTDQSIDTRSIETRSIETQSSETQSY